MKQEIEENCKNSIFVLFKILKDNIVILFYQIRLLEYNLSFCFVRSNLLKKHQRTTLSLSCQIEKVILLFLISSSNAKGHHSLALVLVIIALKSSTRYNTIIFVRGSLEPPLLGWDLVGGSIINFGTVPYPPAPAVFGGVRKNASPLPILELSNPMVSTVKNRRNVGELLISIDSPTNTV